jgi:tetraacyldisaccharide 4'-kinase
MESVAGPVNDLAARLYGLGWEWRRRVYARGWITPERVAARIVSIGNLTTGGTGKTTLTLHLASRARARGIDVAVVVRDYHPGPDGVGDEHRMFDAALGNGAVFGGRVKRRAARAAAAAGHRLVLVDDGFSHWRLGRDLDLVLLDHEDPWGGGALLPAGRLREPRRALQRAGVVVLSRVPAGHDPSPRIAEVRRVAPAALFAAGRHRVTGVRALDGGDVPSGGRVRVVTATGHPRAVAASATEHGFEVTSLAAYRDHHWFTSAETAAERAQAAREGARVLLTSKDAVRWPARGPDMCVLEVAWEWVTGGEAVEQAVLGERG